jgi:GNAT superfamily N-acetyltransferase
MSERMDRTSPVSILPAESAADLAAAVVLFRAYAAALEIDLAYQGFEDELASLPGRYAPPAGALLLARDAAGAAIGCVALRPIEPNGCCEMKRLFVAPEGRGAGLGKSLVEAVIAEAQRIGYREMRLDTLPQMTGAIALYRRFGFEPMPAYYETPVVGTIFMRCRLSVDGVIGRDGAAT